MLIIDENTERLLVPITKTTVNSSSLEIFVVINTATNERYEFDAIVDDNLNGYYDIVQLSGSGATPTPGEYTYQLVDNHGGVQETGILRFIESQDEPVEFVDLPIYREYIQTLE